MQVECWHSCSDVGHCPTTRRIYADIPAPVNIPCDSSRLDTFSTCRNWTAPSPRQTEMDNVAVKCNESCSVNTRWTNEKYTFFSIIAAVQIWPYQIKLKFYKNEPRYNFRQKIQMSPRYRQQTNMCITCQFYNTSIKNDASCNNLHNTSFMQPISAKIFVTCKLVPRAHVPNFSLIRRK